MISLLVLECGNKSLSNKIIYDLIIDITSDNHFRDGSGIPDPYVSLKTILAHYYKLSEAEIDISTFLGSSYHLGILVEILVRRNKITVLSELWKNISYIMNYEFKPKFPWNLFLWRCDEGEEIGSFYKNPQSWGDLIEKATTTNSLVLPKILWKNPDFSFYFLICFPHRLNRHTIKIVDDLTTFSM